MAGPDDLAGLTAVFYAVSYLGFAVPAALAYASQTWTVLTYPVMFAVGALAAIAPVRRACRGAEGIDHKLRRWAQVNRPRAVAARAARPSAALS